jgi:hypothetical protein
LILHLLKVGAEEAGQVRDEMLSGDKSNMPGLIRASFGFYNTTAEIDIFVEALIDITNGKYQGEYIQDTASGEYRPVDWEPKFNQYFSLDEAKR